MEALQSLALKQAFINERNKIDKNKLIHFGPGFSFPSASSHFSKFYKEDEQSKILYRFFSDMELCYCGMIFDKEDRNHYKNYRPNHHFQSEHHKNFDREYEYCSGCGTMELKSEHPCFNPMCECGERYNILSVYCNELTLYGFHEDSSLRHNYYILFGPDY